MELTLRQQAVVLTGDLLGDFYCRRDIGAVLDHLDRSATWIGPGELEQNFSYEEILTYLALSKDATPPCELSGVELRPVDLGADCCMVTGSFMVRSTQDSQMVEVNQRVSVTYRLTGGRLNAVHVHLSNPCAQAYPEACLPQKMGAQGDEYLQRLLREKMEVIDMIAGNINGGLKGSNDDDTFSFFYVNEGLPRMLGYTYAEFMEKTGGTAVGAAYPPDLDAALADCARCFAQGPVYSTEYRIEKKDGSLMWVLDSGRKALNAEGVVKINSIIMDITPLKQALFELQVERERYRVALENITDAMCEYDISQDLFTIYQRVEISGKAELEEFGIPGFSAAVRTRNLVHPEDIQPLLDLFQGKSNAPALVRTNFFHLDGAWRWTQCRCSAISGDGGITVRTVGLMKDVTEERAQTQALLRQAQRDGLTQLLNQKATRDAVNAYLAGERGEADRQGALLMVDLDHFKQLNDTKGHLFGNDVLIATARILKRSGRLGDVVGRTGGDEFVLLLKGMSATRALARADRIISRVAALETPDTPPISCSVGIAFYTEESRDFDTLFQQADTALYDAKHGGRNQRAVCEGTGDTPAS